MDWDPRVLRAHLDHYLPRDVFGPVVLAFSLEGVIDGIFSTYVSDAYATVGWAVVFVLALATVTYWGKADEQAVEELHERIDELEAERADSDGADGPGAERSR